VNPDTKIVDNALRFRCSMEGVTSNGATKRDNRRFPLR
jgi:hypothetical protein